MAVNSLVFNTARMGKIKISRCSDQSLWYRNHIGIEFAIEYIDRDGIWVRTRDYFNTLNLIRFQDIW